MNAGHHSRAQCHQLPATEVPSSYKAPDTSQCTCHETITPTLQRCPPKHSHLTCQVKRSQAFPKVTHFMSGRSRTSPDCTPFPPVAINPPVESSTMNKPSLNLPGPTNIHPLTQTDASPPLLIHSKSFLSLSLQYALLKFN